MHYLYAKDLWNEMNELENELEDIKNDISEAEHDIDDCEDPANPPDHLTYALDCAYERLNDFDSERLNELKNFFDYNSKEDVFVNEDDLGEYAENWLEDTGTKIPHWVHVDWEATGDELRGDMESVEFECSTWYKI